MTRSLVFIGLSTLAFLALGALLDPGSYAVRVLCLIFLTAAMAQAWNITGGLANQISLGHAAFFGIGAYTSTVLQIEFGLTPWIGMGVGAVLAVLAALLLSIPTVRLKGHYFALATLAFSEACRVIANSMGITGGPQGVAVPFIGDAPGMMQFTEAGSYVPVIALLYGVVFAVFAALSHGRIGYMLRAIREDEDAAELSGVSTLQVKVLGTVISAAMVALCGTVFAQFIFFFDPDSIFSPINISVRMALVAIIGGVATLSGPLLGALLLVVLEELFRGWFSDLSSGFSPFLMGVILIAVVLLRPAGLVSALPKGWVRPTAKRPELEKSHA